jgi:hypothetical protein
MSDEEALMRVAEQGFVPEAQTPGPGAPTSAPRLLEALKQARTLGYSVSVDSYIVGMAAMAMPVRADADGRVIGVLSVAGPAARMTPQRMAALAEPLAGAAADLGRASRGSRLFPAATERNTERSDPGRRSLPVRATGSAARWRCGSPPTARGAARILRWC